MACVIWNKFLPFIFRGDAAAGSGTALTRVTKAAPAGPLSSYGIGLASSPPPLLPPFLKCSLSFLHGVVPTFFPVQTKDVSFERADCKPGAAKEQRKSIKMIKESDRNVVLR